MQWAGPDLSKWEIHAFEANPNIVAQYPPEVKFQPVAAWTREGFIDFYVSERNPCVDGASLLSNKRTGHLDLKHPLRVRCIDFPAWSLNLFESPDIANTDRAILKMNVEGAEYNILPAMLSNGSLACFDDLYLEAHCEKIGMPEAESAALLAKVRQVVNLHTMRDFYETFK